MEVTSIPPPRPRVLLSSALELHRGAGEVNKTRYKLSFLSFRTSQCLILAALSMRPLWPESLQNQMTSAIRRFDFQLQRRRRRTTAAAVNSPYLMSTALEWNRSCLRAVLQKLIELENMLFGARVAFVMIYVLCFHVLQVLCFCLPSLVVQ